jgi:cation:H+ antiporter
MCNFVIKKGMIYAYLALGFILLLIGGETLVRGSVAVAQRLKVPPLIVGIVLVGLGTSAPELVTCMEAVLKDVPDLAVGNIVGSNIANILLVVGVGAILAPIATPIRAFQRDGLALLFSTALFVFVCFVGVINAAMGVGFLVLLATYITYSYVSEKRWHNKEYEKDIKETVLVDEKQLKKEGVAFDLILTFGGIALTVLGAKLLVANATILAQSFGISETLIGLTIVAIGTSLPELATAVIAGLRGHSDVSLGNIIGSNIYNILGILGSTAIVQPLSIPKEIMSFDIYIMIGATLMMIFVPLRKKCISREEGFVMASLYFGYLYILYLSAEIA